MAGPAVSDAPSFAAPSVELGDVQALLRFGHGPLEEACFFLLRVVHPAAARAWLSAATVARADASAAPESALQLAFTAEGLKTLGVAETVMAGFAPEFVAGMAGDDNRSRRLGDTDASDPARWVWGRDERMPHVLALLYARPGKLEAAKAALADANWSAGFRVLDSLATAPVDNHEPFGFLDGVSQPLPDWHRVRNANGDALERDYRNLVSLGEFLLGYPNEYGKYTDRPLIDPARDPRAAALPAAEDAPERRDLGRNGTYLVLRQLHQDVRGFWQFLHRESRALGMTPEALGARMVGREIEGKPLMPATREPISGVADTELDQFTFDGDPEGIRCPFGAHIRRANPRTADLPPGTGGFFSRLVRAFGFGRETIRDDLIASARFHRMIRRGRDYGPSLPRTAAISGPPDDAPRGLQFIALVASISRQFEFVQNAWVMNSKFNGMSGESDPLLGNRAPLPGCPATDEFSLPTVDGPPRRIAGLPQFITVRGGAYFFLPGIRALRYIAGG